MGARQLRIDPKTIRRWLAAGQLPDRRRRRPLPTALDAFLDYVHERYDAGLANAAELTRARRPLGFTGSYQAVRRALYRLRRTRPCAVSASSDARTAPRTPGCTRRDTVWLLQRASAELTDAERTYLERLTTACPALAGVRTLALAFRAMLRQRNPHGLCPWLTAAAGSELRRFATSLERDYDAVLAATIFPWSTSPVEGHIRRLTLIERTLYGRAKFTLLRARVLRAT